MRKKRSNLNNTWTSNSKPSRPLSIPDLHEDPNKSMTEFSQFMSQQMVALTSPRARTAVNPIRQIRIRKTRKRRVASVQPDMGEKKS